jgi:hypothetical protein
LDPLDTLTQINLDDLVAAFGWEKHPRLSRTLRALFFRPAHKFAKQMIDFDSAIGQRGLVDASRFTLKRFVQDVRVFGSDLIPAGPFLALSNHPGMTDTLSLFSALNRADLRIIALDRPFLIALPNLSKQLLYVKEEAASRMTLVRQMTSHLRARGAALTFPAGQIEPDPQVYPGASESLHSWTDSIGVFMRMAPETAVLPVLVRNVIWKKTANFPFLNIKKTKEDREKLAAALQLLSMVLWDSKPVSVTVQIGTPITLKELGTNKTPLIHQAVVREMKGLIENPPEGEGLSVI